jgi:NAD(P)-dependent dehydrogenase (short-subunit alcohol dehydrogenase family)
LVLIFSLLSGAQFDPQLQAGKMTMRQVWTQTWVVNTVGTRLGTHAFVPLLLRSQDPRLLFLASGTSSLGAAENLSLPFNKVPEKGWPKTALPAVANVPAYRSAKTGMNMMMR